MHIHRVHTQLAGDFIGKWSCYTYIQTSWSRRAAIQVLAMTLQVHQDVDSMHMHALILMHGTWPPTQASPFLGNARLTQLSHNKILIVAT